MKKGRAIGISKATKDDLTSLGITTPLNVVENADYVFCTGLTTPLMLKDNLKGQCFFCSTPLQFRPHVPTTAKTICLPCGDLLVRADENKVN